MRYVIIHIRSEEFNIDLYKSIEDDSNKRVLFENKKNSASHFIEAWRGKKDGKYRTDAMPMEKRTGFMMSEIPEKIRKDLIPIAIFHIRWKDKKDVNFLKMQNIDEEYLSSILYGS